MQTTAAGITAKELNTFEAIDANVMSGIWSMLEANPMNNGFPITSDGYNIFKDKNIEWLKRPTVEQQAREDATIAQSKCEKWLNKTVKHQK